MFKKHLFKQNSGFTIIELLVVIAIIGLLATIISISLGSARVKARDTNRKSELREMQNALEAYYNDNNRYPCSTPSGSCAGFNWMSSAPSDNASIYSAPGNYIPGLAPTYMVALPADPRPGSSTNPACGGVWQSAFLYKSDGNNYKLLSHCAPEASWNSTEFFYDTVRSTWAWQVSTPGGRDW